MLVFRKARRRVSPALRNESTPSERRLARALVDARREVESWIGRNETALMDAVAHRPWTTVADMIPDEPWYEFQALLQDELTAEAIDAGYRAVDGPVGKAKTPALGYSFDATRPEASQWAAREAGSIVTNITEDQRFLIRDLISRGQVQGITVDQTARTIRQTVGLTPQQSGWVSNFYDRTLTQNINAGMSPSQAAARASAATSRYHDQVHRYRAMTIARTEVSRATSAGRRIAWDQGIQGGFISANAQQEWIAEVDACEICAPRNGMRTPANKPWPDGDPGFVHPNCRCDLLLIPEPISGDFSQLTDEQLMDTIGGLLSGGFPQAATAALSPERVPDDLLLAWVDEDPRAQQRVYGWLSDRVDSRIQKKQAPADQIEAFDGYAGAGYDAMNGLLRGTTDITRFDDRSDDVRDMMRSVFAKAEERTKALAKGIEDSTPIKTDLQVYRGIFEIPEKWDVSVGSVIVEDGFMSTSVIRSAAAEFAGNARLEIVAPKGTRAITGTVYEAEVIFAPGTKMRIIDIETQGSRTVIKCEIIP